MTVVRQPEHEMGWQVTQLLIERILGDYSGAPREVVLPAQVVIRRSCGAQQHANGQTVPSGATAYLWDDD